jgi:hypothetical protein
MRIRRRTRQHRRAAAAHVQPHWVRYDDFGDGRLPRFLQKMTVWRQVPDYCRPRRLSETLRRWVDMYHADHPNGAYQVVNKVQVLDPPRAIGWLTGQDKGDGHLEFGGWMWRYDLAPLGPSETEVALTYDWSAVPQFIRERGIQFPPFGTEHLPNSLHHLAELAAPTSRA